MIRAATKLAGSDKARFVAAGASTTVFSYLLFVALLQLMPPKPAYLLAYLAGIVWSYWVNSVWVFRRAMSWSGLLAFPLVYLAQWVVAFGLFSVAIDHLALPSLLAPILVAVLMLPLSYVLGRAIIRRTGSPPA